MSERIVWKSGYVLLEWRSNKQGGAPMAQVLRNTDWEHAIAKTLDLAKTEVNQGQVATATLITAKDGMVVRTLKLAQIAGFC